jgi:diacylglycerol O-acyltransferase
MTASDAAWYRMDRPGNQADIVALLGFDGPLDLDRVRRVVEERLLRLDRFRQRVVPARVGPPAWEPDPGFSLDRHLAEARLGGGALRDFVGEVTTSTLDPARPLWRLHVVEDGGRGALVAKLHHALGDGFALIAVLLSLADGGADDGARRPRPAPAPRRGAAAAAARIGARYLPALARLVALRGDPADVAAVPLSGVRRVAWSGGLPLAPLREAARRRGGTSNDLLVAAVAGALRAHLARAGKDVARAHRAFVPVNLRAARPDLGAGDPLGNEFGLVFLDLPVDVAAREERFDAVRRAIASLRRGADPALTRELLAWCGWLPDAAHHALTRFFARKTSVVITNVPGPRRRIELAGREVTSAMFWVPQPASLALGVSILSYAGEVRIGVRADVALVPEPAELLAGIEAEVAALAGA